MLRDEDKNAVFFRSAGRDGDGDFQIFATPNFKKKGDRISMTLQHQYADVYKLTLGGLCVFVGNKTDADGDH